MPNRSWTQRASLIVERGPQLTDRVVERDRAVPCGMPRVAAISVSGYPRWHSPLADFAFAMQGLGSGAIPLAGTPAQQAAYLPAVGARGHDRGVCAQRALMPAPT